MCLLSLKGIPVAWQDMFPLAAIDPTVGVIVAAGVTALFGFFGILVKLIRDLQADNKELQNKVMDRAIPALESNAEATKLMVSVTQQALTALAVAQAVKDNDDNRLPKGSD